MWGSAIEGIHLHYLIEKENGFSREQRMIRFLWVFV